MSLFESALFFLKVIFFLLKTGWSQLCLYIYLPGVQSGGQETVLGNEMTQVLIHVIPEPERLRVNM